MLSAKCFETASKYKRILNVKIRNSEAQARRIDKHMKIIGLLLFYVFLLKGV